MSVRYGEMHSHDHHSTLDGSGTAFAGAKYAAELGHSFLCKTNHAVLSGVFHHVGACKEVGIMPLIAVEAYYRPSRFPPLKKTAVGTQMVWRCTACAQEDENRGCAGLCDRCKAPMEYVESTKFDGVDKWPYFHMILVAKNAVGWRSLRMLTSEAYRSGFHKATKERHSSRKPCVDDDLLDRMAEDIFISTTCVAGYVPQMILQGRMDEAEAFMRKMERWAPDACYGEIQTHAFPEQSIVNDSIIALCKARGWPWIVARDSHFVRPEDHANQRALVLMRTRSTVAEHSKEAEEESRSYDLVAMPSAHLASVDQTLRELLENHSSISRADAEAAVANTTWVADQCVPVIFDRSPKIPSFRPGQTSERDLEELRDLAVDGLTKLGKIDDPRFTDQLERELKIYDERKICPFFLITHDFVRWGRSTDPLPELPGGSTPENDPFFWATAKGGGRTEPLKIGSRGSAGGSVALYALRITLPNPIAYGFFFERFLNPNRQGLPDVDLDMAEEAARLLEAYVSRKYGKNKVVDLIAHGTFGPKAALRRVSAVYGVPPGEYTAAGKLIANDESDEKLADLRASIPELDRYFEKHDPEMFRVACGIQGGIQSISEHPAGLLLSSLPLEEAGMPVMRKSIDDDYMVTAVGETATTELKSKEDVELVTGMGFMKVDLLRIIELAKHALAERLINQLYDDDVRLEELPPYDDPCDVEEGAMEKIRQGRLMGIFQLSGSAGIIRFTKNAQPRNINDLAAISAIYRPATLKSELDKEYVARRRDPEKITYWHPLVKPVLEETLGLMVFQEQLMQVLIVLGGFDAPRADDVRKIMSKYYRAKGDLAQRMLGAHKEDFVSHAATLLGSVKSADAVWANAGEFSAYSFNKCVSGKTVIERSAAGRYCPDPKTTIEEVWRIQEGPRSSMRDKLRRQGLQILQMDADGRVRPGKLKQIHFNGVKDLYRVTLSSGKYIDATDNHRLFGDKGYVMVRDLSIGDGLVVMGEREGYIKKGRNTRADGATYEGSGFQEGDKNPAWIDGRKKMLADAKAAVAKRAGGRCEECGKRPGDAKHALEFAHTSSVESFGGDYSRYHSADNARLLCNSCHKRFDYAKGERKKRWSKGRPTLVEEVVSIEYIGEEPTYDVEMDTEEHNFVANGIISHNTHAGSYGLTGYTDAWLKWRYPEVFWASLLTFPGSKVKKKEERKPFYEKLVREARLDGVDILPPDINDSEGGFTITKDGVRFGLQGIAGIGPAAVQELMANRPFVDLDDLIQRVDKRKCNAGHRAALGASGALDRWGVRDHLSEDERAESETRTLNLVLSAGDRVKPYKAGIMKICHTQAEFDELPNGSALIVGGEIIGGEEKETKAGISLKATLAFGADEYRLSWAPWEYDDKVKEMINADRPLIIKGHKDTRWNCVKVDSIDLAHGVLESMGLLEEPAPQESINLEAFGVTT